MNSSLRRVLPSLLVVLAVAAGGFPARAQEPAAAAAADPFVYEAPSGWKPERIPFPLGFAPSLAYSGFEQLHFAPGMFDPTSETYFTYLFFWWVEGKPDVTEQSLARDLVAYYRGLTAAVGEPKGLKFDLTKVDAKVEAAVDEFPPRASATGVRRFTGRLATFDPFKTGKALALEVEITAWRCEREKHSVVFFCVSPKPRDAAVWTPMREALASFRCGDASRDETPTLRAEGPSAGPDSVSASRVPNDGPGSARGGVGDGTGPRLPTINRKARVLNNPRPVYPEELRATGIHGNVVVRVVLGADRTVKSATVVRGLDPAIDAEALKAVYRLEFEPARDTDGKPIDSTLTVAVNFSIR